MVYGKWYISSQNVNTHSPSDEMFPCKIINAKSFIVGLYKYNTCSGKWCVGENIEHKYRILCIVLRCREWECLIRG